MYGMFEYENPRMMNLWWTSWIWLEDVKMAKFDLSLLIFRLGKVLVKPHWLFPNLGLITWYKLDCHICIITCAWKWQLPTRNHGITTRDHAVATRNQSVTTRNHTIATRDYDGCDSQPKRDNSRPRLRLATTAWQAETSWLRLETIWLRLGCPLWLLGHYVLWAICWLGYVLLLTA